MKNAKRPGRRARLFGKPQVWPLFGKPYTFKLHDPDLLTHKLILAPTRTGMSGLGAYAVAQLIADSQAPEPLGHPVVWEHAGAIPTLDELKALDGRIFAMLSPQEQTTLEFYRRQGRKYDVAINILVDADPGELATAISPAHVDELMKRANSIVKVFIGPNAASAWEQRNNNAEVRP